MKRRAMGGLLALALACGGEPEARRLERETEEAATESESPAVARVAVAEREAGAVARLSVDPAEHDFASHPGLLARLRREPHAYLRFIATPFAAATCDELADDVAHAPPVNLHGDAHLEQYAVTDFGRGITDFDGATRGPGVLDLVRLGVSITLACRAHGWEGERDGILDALLRGYDVGLSPDPQTPAEPALVARVRRSFSQDHVALLAGIEELMEPMSAASERTMRAAFAPYVELQRETDPTLGPRHFEIVRLGEIDVGIGSALDHKVLFRVRGATDAPADDVILEAKQVRSLDGIPCIQGAGELDPFRILLGETRIAYHPFPHLGAMRTDERVYWVHGWAENYHELEVESFSAPAELREVAHDIGVQLGRGHVNRIAAPLDAHLRRAQRQFLAERRAELEESVDRLTAATLEAWRRFRERTEAEGA